MDRRAFFNGMAGVALAPGATSVLLRSLQGFQPSVVPSEIAGDEAFWLTVRQAYTMDRSIVNLNSGGCSQPSRQVLEAQQKRESFAAMAQYHNLWHLLNKTRQGVKVRLGRIAGVPPKEIAIVRNTTEAMCLVFYGVDFKDGDEILAGNLEYPGMISALKQLSMRRKVVLKRFNVPLVPSSMDELAQSFMKAAGPKTKMILVSHMAFPNGQVFPVKEICRQARMRGILTVVDGAHSFAHVGPKVAEIGCDFYGTSLHKWLGAPMGTGMLWMRPELVEKTWPLFYSPDAKSSDMTKFEHYGSHPVPIVLSIAEAAAFHEVIGFKRINARLHFLKKWWVDRVKDLPGLELVSNPAPEHTCALAAFTIKGRSGSDIYGYLWKEHKILTTPIGGGDAGFNGVRISPNVYNSTAELDCLVKALRDYTRRS